MIVPLCPICGHQMYYAGDVSVQGVLYKRYACVHCDHVEDWFVMGEIDREEFLL